MPDALSTTFDRSTEAGASTHLKSFSTEFTRNICIKGHGKWLSILASVTVLHSPETSR
ncbi:MAG: hypothetical protein R2769_04505 [Saprospiraceae bacterium]